MSVPVHDMNPGVRLDALLAGCAVAPAFAVTGLAVDSRRVTPGSLFLACRGETHHGLDFCRQAVQSGAAAIAYDASTASTAPTNAGIPVIAVDDLASRLGEIANRFYDSPSKQIKVFGITGTNGKTSVAWLLAECLDRLGHACGYAGTLGFGLRELNTDNDMTSPDIIEHHRRLATFRDAGAGYAAVEVSSHALDQRRVDGTSFEVAILTNLSRDHLDYHGDMRAYGDAKSRLFLDYPANSRVINVDSTFGAELAERCGRDAVAVSLRTSAIAKRQQYVAARSLVSRANGSDVRLQTSWGDASLFVPMVGEFNVANALSVIASLLTTGIALDDACDALAHATSPPGRMQRVIAAAGPAVYIDYAHTPDALEAAIGAVRAHCRGNVWCVFGCGGDRDKGKRAQMGRIAERLADRIVITNDNPRNESPRAILDAIAAGLDDTAAAITIEDRAQAIDYAIVHVQPDDAVLVAGKGHENYQLIGGRRLDFSDYRVALAVLESLPPRGDA